MYANYLKLDTLAGLARSSDKMVTNLLSVAEGFTVQQLPPAVYSFLLYVIYTTKWPLLNAIRNPNLVLIFNIKLENDWGGGGSSIILYNNRGGGGHPKINFSIGGGGHH